MKKTEEQLKYLIDMYQEMISPLSSRTQALYTKAEDDHNWYEDEDYPPYVPCLEEIKELSSVLEDRQKSFLEEMIELRLREGIADRESNYYYDQMFRVGYKDAQALTNKLISNVLNSNLKDTDKEDHVNFIKKLAPVYGVDLRMVP